MDETPTTPSASRVASTSAANLVPSPHYTTTRRHSLYGTEDRIVIDLGSRLWKVGFSGEGRPRDVFLAANPRHGSSLWSFTSARTAEEREDARTLLEHRLQDALRSVFFDSLLVDPRSRKVIVVEHPLLPLEVKEAVARILFQNLQVPSISFAPSHVLSLIAAGRLTGLVLDCGYLESSVLPIFGSRPLYTSIQTTPVAGARLNAHLRSLILLFGIYLPPMGVVGSAAKPTTVPEDVLTDSVIEEIKTRCCFVGEPIQYTLQRPRSPSVSTSGTDDAMSVDTSDYSARSESGQSMDYDPPDSSIQSSNPSHAGRQVTAMRNLYLRNSTATELTIRVPAPGAPPAGPGVSTSTRASIVLPGWIRERAAEVLFEDGDVDETSVAEVVLDTLLKVPVDLRKDFVSSIVVAGGTAMVPGFIPRLHAELVRLLSPRPPPPQPPVPAPSSSPSTPTQRSLFPRGPPPPPMPQRPAVVKPPYDPYAILRPLAPFIAILNNPDPPSTQSSVAAANAGKAPAFAPASLPWIGGSLAGSLKTGGEEILRERWDEAFEDSLLPPTPSSSAPSTPGPVATPGAGRSLQQGRPYLLPDWTRPPLGSEVPSVYASA